MSDQELCKKLENLLWASCPVPEWSVHVSMAPKNIGFNFPGEPAVGKRSDFPERQFKGDILVYVRFNGKRPTYDGRDEDAGLCTPLQKEEILKHIEEMRLEKLCSGIMKGLAVSLNMMPEEEKS